MLLPSTTLLALSQLQLPTPISTVSEPVPPAESNVPPAYNLVLPQNASLTNSTALPGTSITFAWPLNGPPEGYVRFEHLTGAIDRSDALEVFELVGQQAATQPPGELIRPQRKRYAGVSTGLEIEFGSTVTWGQMGLVTEVPVEFLEFEGEKGFSFTIVNVTGFPAGDVVACGTLYGLQQGISARNIVVNGTEKNANVSFANTTALPPDPATYTWPRTGDVRGYIRFQHYTASIDEWDALEVFARLEETAAEKPPGEIIEPGQKTYTGVSTQLKIVFSSTMTWGEVGEVLETPMDFLEEHPVGFIFTIITLRGALIAHGMVYEHASRVSAREIVINDTGENRNASLANPNSLPPDPFYVPWPDMGWGEGGIGFWDYGDPIDQHDARRVFESVAAQAAIHPTSQLVGRGQRTYVSRSATLVMTFSSILSWGLLEALSELPLIFLNNYESVEFRFVITGVMGVFQVTGILKQTDERRISARGLAPNVTEPNSNTTSAARNNLPSDPFITGWPEEIGPKVYNLGFWKYGPPVDLTGAYGCFAVAAQLGDLEPPDELVSSKVRVRKFQIRRTSLTLEFGETLTWGELRLLAELPAELFLDRYALVEFSFVIASLTWDTLIRGTLSEYDLVEGIPGNGTVLNQTEARSGSSLVMDASKSLSSGLVNAETE